MKTSDWIGILILMLIASCSQEKQWDIKLENEKVDLEFINISDDFFDETVSLSELYSKYPFFFDDSVEAEEWENRRKDSLELEVYAATKEVFAENSEYKVELEKLFARYQYFFPDHKLPVVYTYSSGLQNIYEPILFGSREGGLFIALDGFLGSESKWYAMMGVFPYLSDEMNPENLIPRVAQSIGRDIVPFNPSQQDFIDLIIDEGKKLIVADALIPDYPNELKIGYSIEHYEWAKNNEGGIWNYFVEQNMIFESDRSYRERFINPAPFSKFLNEIELDSPGRIGVWVGWQICKSYLKHNSDVSLEEFLNLNNQEIFKESKYKPKKPDGDYTPLRIEPIDEIGKYE